MLGYAQECSTGSFLWRGKCMAEAMLCALAAIARGAFCERQQEGTPTGVPSCNSLPRYFSAGSIMPLCMAACTPSGTTPIIAPSSLVLSDAP